jgi:shikimate kinase
MRGAAVASGAISLVNAIASGRGATVGVDLKTEARVEVTDGKGRWEIEVNGERTKSKLVVESVRAALRTSGVDPEALHGYAETTTSIPLGVGLKGSSSASVAVTMAVFDALGRRGASGESVLGCSVGASLASGVSITGALDDAASCFFGGVNLADNTISRVLSSNRLTEKMEVVIRVPAEKSRRPMLKLGEARMLARAADSLVELCERGDYWAAMTLNGLMYSGLLGYKLGAGIEALRLGALGSGLSGTGPSIAAVFDSRRSRAVGKIVDAWSGDGASVIRTTTSNAGARFLD